MYPCIFVTLDGSEIARGGLQEAIRLAQGLGTRLVLWHAIENFPTLSEVASARTLDELSARRRHDAQAFLDEAKQLAAGQGVEAVTAVVQSAVAVPEAIIEAVAQAGCGLIVMGTNGRSGFSRLALGSVAERVARLSPVPVMLVPPRAAA